MTINLYTISSRFMLFNICMWLVRDSWRLSEIFFFKMAEITILFVFLFSLIHADSFLFDLYFFKIFSFLKFCTTPSPRVLNHLVQTCLITSRDTLTSRSESFSFFSINHAYCLLSSELNSYYLCSYSPEIMKDIEQSAYFHLEDKQEFDKRDNQWRS